MNNHCLIYKYRREFSGSLRCWPLILIAAILLAGCSKDKDKQPEYTSFIKIYGMEYPVQNASVWEGASFITYSKEEFIFKDQYVNAFNQEITDEVVGFKPGKDFLKTGNFMFSLYGEGLFLEDKNNTLAGSGAVITFHLRSTDVSALAMGTYEFSGTGKDPFTFTGYYSTRFDRDMEANAIASVSSGTLKLSEDGKGGYQLVFNGVTSNGADISVIYDGLNLQSFKLVKQDFVSYVSKRITGIAKDSVSVYTALPVPEPPADWETAISKQKLPDTKYNAGLFMTSTGAVRYAADAANRDQVEIAVVYDKINGRIFLESPVRIRAYIDHSNTYNHPLHTVYQKTPSSFSETDFNNLKGSDLPADVFGETVEFDVENFNPGYYYFLSGNGTKGVIHVKGFIAADYIYSSPAPIIWVRQEQSASLIVDIKSPAIYNDPKIL